METVFTLASISSIETLLKLMNEFYAHEHLSFDEQAARSALKLILNNNSYGQIYLIHQDKQIIGYLVVTFGFSIEYGGRDAFIDEFYIQQKYRGQGIGKQGLQLAEQICREQGVQALHLEVESKNIHAQTVYKKAGFVESDRYLLSKWL
ncbi:GNAT family N-acetyltransferase [Calothrix sp. FACHB-1219]|uniref:GNAT family N-acetyltransferase n=1 Tax=unclassified Calothrix TaxID=2619626 RepID=UPI0016860CEF|nr:MULTISPECIES: GNAT family N-acetyltransferase [unclassified Calothrix]MBD2204832.1 GNAT family N-acetyltransferase [Calothrix sp. FACHB-168]MBD2218020.1 GNAT family N-acetyltransferase [Calothrix sp. FACHB-1219]